MNRAKEHPLDVVSPFADLEALSATSENEPGKQGRVLLGHQPDGTAIYGRLPTGKIGEEFTGWLTQPLYLLKNKEGTLARPIFNTLANDRGFGQKVYDPNWTGIKGAAANIGRIAWEFLRNEIPEMQVRAVQQIVSGSDKAWLPWAQLVSRSSASITGTQLALLTSTFASVLPEDFSGTYTTEVIRDPANVFCA